MAAWTFEAATFNTALNAGINVLVCTPMQKMPFGYFNNETYFNETGGVNAIYILGLTPAPEGPYIPDENRHFRATVGTWSGPEEVQPNQWSIYFTPLAGPPGVEPQALGSTQEVNSKRIELKLTAASQLNSEALGAAKTKLEGLLTDLKLGSEEVEKVKDLISEIEAEIK